MSIVREIDLTQEEIMLMFDTSVESQLSGDKNPLLILGMPGFGKSDLVVKDYPEWKLERGSRCLGIEHPKVGVFTIILSRSDSTDFEVPAADLENLVLRKLSDGNILGISEASGEYDIVVVFLDEATSAETDTLISVQSIVQSGEMSGRKKAPNCVYIAAGNRPEDFSGAKHMPASTNDRFTVVNLAPSISRWIEWAKRNNIDPRIVGAVMWGKSNGKNLLYRQPKERGEVFPTGRSYQRLDASIRQGATENILEAFGSGNLGDQTWIEVKGFFKMSKELPYIDDIIDNPEGAKLPGSIDPTNGPSGQYVIATGIARWLQERKENEIHVETREASAFMKYFDRMSPEIAIYGVNLCAEVSNEAITMNKEFTKFMNKHRDVTLYTGKWKIFTPSK